MPCSHKDFELTITDAGVCYTFNSKINANSTIKATGITVDQDCVNCCVLRLQVHTSCKIGYEWLCQLYQFDISNRGSFR